jgi:hypothetical protein
MVKPKRLGYSLATMKLTNAIKKLTSAGFTVTEHSHGMFVAKKAGLTHHVQFTRNGGTYSDEVATIGVVQNGDKSDGMSDYCATTFCDSVKRAMELCGDWGVRLPAKAVAPIAMRAEDEDRYCDASGACFSDAEGGL